MNQCEVIQIHPVFYICNWSIKKHVNYSVYLELSAEAALPAVIVPFLQSKCTLLFISLSTSPRSVCVCVFYTHILFLTVFTFDLRHTWPLTCCCMTRWSINHSNSYRCKSRDSCSSCLNFLPPKVWTTLHPDCIQSPTPWLFGHPLNNRSCWLNGSIWSEHSRVHPFISCFH